MPWLYNDSRALLTTDDGLGSWWGTLIAGAGYPKYGTGPLVHSSVSVMHYKVYYWMRENVTGTSLSLSL